MMRVSIHAVTLENTDSQFVISEGSHAEDVWDAFPRLHTRTQHSGVTVLLERPPALSWTSEKLGSTAWAVPPCFRKGQVGTSSDVKALKLKSGSVLYRRALLGQNCR